MDTPTGNRSAGKGQRVSLKRWAQEPPPTLTAEQCLQWLDSVRTLMFEVWRSNPALRKAYEHAHTAGLT